MIERIRNCVVVSIQETISVKLTCESITPTSISGEDAGSRSSQGSSVSSVACHVIGYWIVGWVFWVIWIPFWWLIVLRFGCSNIVFDRESWCEFKERAFCGMVGRHLFVLGVRA